MIDSKQPTPLAIFAAGFTSVRAALRLERPEVLRSTVTLPHGRRSPRRRNRDGITLILAILCLAVSTMLIANLTRMIRLDGQNRMSHQHALQAEWLAQFGWKHAANQLAQDPTYSGGAWEFSLPTDTTDRPKTADNVGRITVSLQRENQPITVTVVAQYPADQPNQVTKTLKKTLSMATSTPE